VNLKSLRSRYGLPLPVEVLADEYTVDIPENQLLRGAAIRLLGCPACRWQLAEQIAAQADQER
jgi:5-methylcytosine-specific restriction enzyme subunit McrC